jgi:hypothetical protein
MLYRNLSESNWHGSTTAAEDAECFMAIEEALRQRVERARERYLAAVAQAEGIAPDGGGPYPQALLIQREARAMYLDDLRIFSDLVLKRKAPPGPR